ncbi:MAG: glycerophosphodiester phosphodiesterase family protein [Acidobacteriota bacterium]
MLTAARSGCSWIALRRGSRRAIWRARARGLRTLVWTVDDPVEMKECRASGVDALCTNAPGLARRVLGA